MKSQREERYGQLANRLIFLQIAATVVLSATAMLISTEAAFSGLVGGGICVIGNTCFARAVFRPMASRPAKEVLVSIYASEIGKLVLVMVLFFTAFKSVVALQETQNALVMFIAFVAAQGVNIFAPMWLDANDQ